MRARPASPRPGLLALLRRLTTLAAVVAALTLGPAAVPLRAAPAALQPASSGGVPEIARDLARLGDNRRVMILGAHPDDEDNALLGTVSRVEGVEMAYLALSRGDGGQNLIGDELGPALGVLRSEELLAARRIDYARQLFTRAYDFGFTESMEETFQRWPRQELLVDVVRAIRRFRPQVLIAVFPPDPRAGHGQHQVSGALAEDAMKAAGEPDAFPQLTAEGLPPWQPQVFLREAWWDPEHADLVLPTTVLDPLTGRSGFQLGMEARSQHRSQSQGALQGLEGRPTRLSRVTPPPPGSEAGDLFAGVDTSLVALARFLPAGPAQGHVRVLLADVAAQTAAAQAALGPASLDAVAAPLATALLDLQDVAATVDAQPPSAGKQHLAALVGEKVALATDALAAASGLVLDATTERADVVPGEELAVTTRLWNGGHGTVRVRRLALESPAAWSPPVPVPLERSASGRIAATMGAPPPGNVAAGQGASLAPSGGGPGAGSGASGETDAEPPPAPESSAFELPAGAQVSAKSSLAVDAAATPTVPYFLAQPRQGDLYDWSGVPPAVQDEPFQPPPLVLRAELELAVPPATVLLPAASGDTLDARAGAGRVERTVGGERAILDAPAPVTLTLTREVVAVTRDLALGEVRRPLRTVPAVEVAVAESVIPWPVAETAPRTLHVTLTAHGATRQGELGAQVPEGWPAVAAVPFHLAAGESRTFDLALAPPAALAAGRSGVEVHATTEDGRRFAMAYPLVDYPHVRPRPLPQPAQVAISAFALALPRLGHVGYVRGAADRVPEALRAVGVPLEVVSAAELRSRDLHTFDALVLGSRAYDAQPDLAAVNDRLLDYVRNGGLLLVQTQRTDYFKANLAPLPMSMTGNNAARTTDETAPVRLLQPENPVLNAPNAIGPADWEGWVQERGLYYPTQWDPGYTPLLAMADPGKPELEGSLLVAPVGKGTYVYTGLAFFRQLPAGVPGAFRLFANLLGLAKPQVESEDLPEGQGR